MPDSQRSHVVFLGGRSGVGKSSIAAEMHARLGEQQVKHAMIEGDVLDLAWPPPWEQGLAENNLKAMWGNYRELGYRRLVFTNTVSVIQQHELTTAMGDDPIVTAFLLQCNDETARQRLGAREIGSELQSHLERSDARSAELERSAPADVIRVCTDHRSVRDIAEELLNIIGWISTEKDNDNE